MFGLTFSPLWQSVLMLVHPAPRYVAPQPWHRGANSGARYPDWRLRDPEATRRLIDAPVAGLLFDVEENDFWWNAWGPPPATNAQRLQVASRELANVPRLTPLWGHWYIADSDDSPVFSIVQADLYIPAVTLAGLPTGQSQDSVPAHEYPIGAVPFWSDLHAYSQLGHEHGPFGSLGTGGL